MWWLLVGVFGCSGQSGPASSRSGGLPADGLAARAALIEALVAREPAQVAGAARVASQWEGEDPALDRALGDALANVLLRPADGLGLLESAPAPGDPDWERAVTDAAVRTGDRRDIARVGALVGWPVPDLDARVLPQVTALAARDPAAGWALMADVIADCALLDGQPLRGRQPLDTPAPPTLVAAAQLLGAARVVAGRAEGYSEARADTQGGDFACDTGRRISPATVPVPLPRYLVLGADFDDGPVWLNIRETEDQPWAFAASDAERAKRWVAAALVMQTDGPAAARAQFGVGAAPTTP